MIRYKYQSQASRNSIDVQVFSSFSCFCLTYTIPTIFTNMRSFALTILTSVAFGALSWAAPLNVNANGQANVETGLLRRDPLSVNANGQANVETGLLRRDGSPIDINVAVDASVDLLRRGPSPAVDASLDAVADALKRGDKKKSLVTIIVGVIVEITPLAEKLSMCAFYLCCEIL